MGEDDGNFLLVWRAIIRLERAKVKFAIIIITPDKKFKEIAVLKPLLRQNKQK